MRSRTIVLSIALTLAAGGAMAEGPLRERLIGNENPMAETPAPQLPQPMTDGPSQVRNYPEQPPVIPHDISGYELSVRANTCMTCHRRQYTGESGAPMISITHFRDREGQTLADVSARRYFCTQCHVPQTRTRALIDNEFTDMTELTADDEE